MYLIGIVYIQGIVYTSKVAHHDLEAIVSLDFMVGWSLMSFSKY